MAWQGVITNAGAQILNQWALGQGRLEITRAEAGAETVQASALKAQTEVSHDHGGPFAAAVIRSEKTANGTRFKVNVTPDETAYVAHQVGIYARLSSWSTSTMAELLAIVQDTSGVAIPARSTDPDFVFTIYIATSISNTDEIDITVDTAALVTQADLTDAIDDVTGSLKDAAYRGVANNLTQAAAATNVLDAYQGKVLKDLIDSMCVQPGTVTYTFVGSGYITTGKTQIMVKFPIDKFIGNRTIASYSVSDFQVRQNGNNIWASSEGFNELELALTPTNAGISINAYRKQNGEHVVINSAAVNNETVGIYLVVSITWA